MAKKKEEEVPQELTKHELEVPTTTTEQEEKAVAVVIFYSKESAKGNELFYLIQSIRKFLQVPKMQIIVAGDKEDWFDENIIHSQFTEMQDIATSINSDKFVIVQQNTFFLRNCLLAHLEIPKHCADGNNKLPKFFFRNEENGPLFVHNIMTIPADWDTTPWFVPVVSENPDPTIFSQYAESRFFMIIDQDAWGEFIENFFKELLDVEAPVIKEGI